MARVPVGVRERAEWAPFGKALEGNVGTTMRSYDDLHFEVPGERVKSDLDKFIENNTSTVREGGQRSCGRAELVAACSRPANSALCCRCRSPHPLCLFHHPSPSPAPQSIFKCTICGGGHSTLKCPYRDVMPAGGAMGGAGAGAGAGAAAAGAGGPGAGAGTGAYVPPHLKDGFRGGGAGGEGDIPEYELRRIRIGNLHEDAEEDEVRALVDTPLGRVEKVTLARHKESGKVTAAYVQFSSHEAADAIRRNLDGFGYEHLVLKVEWARPNPNKDFTGSAGLSGGFVSGCVRDVLRAGSCCCGCWALSMGGVVPEASPVCSPLRAALSLLLTPPRYLPPPPLPAAATARRSRRTCASKQHVPPAAVRRAVAQARSHPRRCGRMRLRGSVNTATEQPRLCAASTREARGRAA